MDREITSNNKLIQNLYIIVLPPSHRETQSLIYIWGTFNDRRENSTYLGITFDRRLTLKKKIENAVGKVQRKLCLLRKLAATNCGVNEKTLKQIYTWGNDTTVGVLLGGMGKLF